VLDKEKVMMVAEAFEVEVLEEDAVGGLDTLAKKTTEFTDEDDLEFLEPRAPVVTIMGHVDHGKTSLLDYIRKTRVAAGEAGGITQAIGAYQVSPLIGGNSTPITFLDTPGHEAFSAMRARGARVTDIAVIMVAADDGVRPQTLEAISHAQAAGVPMVVALNKIDKEGANPERVKQELSAAGLLPEEWGGTTPVVPISAKKGTGIDTLLETLLLLAEVGELSANPQRPARGTVVEAYMDKARGATATLLVQAGTLRLGDVVLCGPSYGRVRALLSDAGARVQEAGPSTPVQMLGLDCVPAAGDVFDVCADEDEARERAEDARDALLAARLLEQSSGQAARVVLNTPGSGGLGSVSAEDAEEELLKRLNVVLKTDVSGSLEAVKAATSAIAQDRVQLRFLAAAAGEVTASDIDLASASGSLVLAFNMPLSEEIQVKAKQRGVDVRSYDIIYALVDDVKAAMEAMLKPVTERVPLGEAEVRGVFGTGSTGKVAGCMITSGKLVAKCQIAVKRGKEVVFEGRLDSLRRMKDIVKELGSGYECGVGSEFSGWKEGDKVEAYDLVTKRVILPMRGGGAPAGGEAAAAERAVAAAGAA
jgi:translation initiation factor IF-2